MGNKVLASKMDDCAIFGSVSAKKGQKWAQNRVFQNWPNKFAPKSKFNLAIISKPKILEFYHTLRKTWQIDI